jgi:hypothetical protein
MTTTYTTIMSYCLGLFILLGSFSNCSCQKNAPPPATTSTTSIGNPYATPPPPTPPASSLEQAIRTLEESVLGTTTPNSIQKDIYDAIAVLPPRQFKVDTHGKQSRINPEKNGRELFDKLLANLSKKSPEATKWLIEQQLLDPQAPNEAGKTPLEAALEAFETTLYPETAHKIIQILLDNGGKLPPDKASAYIASLMEQGLKKNSMDDDNKAVIQLLQNHQGAITTEKAVSLLENLTKNKSADITLIEGLLQLLPSDLSLSAEKADELLQAASSSPASIPLYTYLVEKGADPDSITVDYLGEKVSLWKYSIKKVETDLNKALLKDPKTNINEIIDPDNQFTFPMERAYNRTGVHSIEKMLSRGDLDINTTTAKASGVNGYTLLDIVVDNCLAFSGGSNSQEKANIKVKEQWLEVLKKMKQHPNFKLTATNLQHFNANAPKATQHYNAPEYRKKSKEIANEVGDLLSK